MHWRTLDRSGRPLHPAASRRSTHPVATTADAIAHAITGSFAGKDVNEPAETAVKPVTGHR